MSKCINYNQIAYKYDKSRDLKPEIIINLVGHLKKLMQNLKDKTALEIGIGTGRFGLPLSKEFMKYTGIDISKNMLKILKKKKGNENRIEIFNMDGTTMIFNDSTFDILFAFSVLHLVEDWERLIYEIKRVTKKDGYFVFGRMEYLEDEESKIYEQLRHKIVRKSEDIGLSYKDQLVELERKFGSYKKYICGTIEERKKIKNIISNFEKRTWSETWELTEKDMAKKIEEAKKFIVKNQYKSELFVKKTFTIYVFGLINSI